MFDISKINIYKSIFLDICQEVLPYIINDFTQLKGQKRENLYNDSFYYFTCSKIFDLVVKSFEKSGKKKNSGFLYNGVFYVQDKIFVDSNNFINGKNIIENSNSFKKKNIVYDKNGELRLQKAVEKHNLSDERIVVFPIDGLPSFISGFGDFSFCLCLQSKNEKNLYKNIMFVVFNPLQKDTLIINEIDGVLYNGNKIINNQMMKEKFISSIFVNDYHKKFSFDLTKLSQVSYRFTTSCSIFWSLSLLLITNFNLCIYDKNDELLEYVKFICKMSYLDIKEIGYHLLIGNEKVLSSLSK